MSGKLDKIWTKGDFDSHKNSYGIKSKRGDRISIEIGFSELLTDGSKYFGDLNGLEGGINDAMFRINIYKNEILITSALMNGEELNKFENDINLIDLLIEKNDISVNDLIKKSDKKYMTDAKILGSKLVHHERKGIEKLFLGDKTTYEPVSMMGDMVKNPDRVIKMNYGIKNTFFIFPLPESKIDISKLKFENSTYIDKKTGIVIKDNLFELSKVDQNKPKDQIQV